MPATVSVCAGRLEGTVAEPRPLLKLPAEFGRAEHRVSLSGGYTPRVASK